MPAFIDLNGQRFGKLVVQPKHKKKLSSGRIRTFWKCLCDCGKITWGQVNMLQNGHKRSCGCLWDSTLPKGEADLRAKFRAYQAGAKKRGYRFELTMSEFEAIAKCPCHYCDAKPPNTKTRECFNGSSKTNGIDRQINTEGYVLGNCLPCCARCNKAKGDMTYEEFVSMCRKVANNVDS